MATLPMNTAFSRRSQSNAHRICAMPNNARVLSRYPPYGAAWVCCPSFFGHRAETRGQWLSGLFSQNIKEVLQT